MATEHITKTNSATPDAVHHFKIFNTGSI